ncbi:DEAD-box ATP-dependent RNA helicase 39 [Morus notabilis]|uniref:DEAD-box ATP-dependent RNA helicase 39 n=1 Tax=Morus notabilis TaxID=981085 RepID=W9R456_9ROSA|nr:DEAD-box ATP-dependent RNA helicase 39 [Morus notabilis]XP_024033013.1 DEAD-box ATP-dependent RNA helicase 39 [Morus notabilis]XP_024033014.1 DEAD-box ATP-dependent RNA helicase 39 [Morus notabilis]EXB37790.1 DEAD-box ATP-dependent RNA helicase 39 [Morus notabilis]
MQLAMGGATAKTLLTISLSSHLSSLSRFSAAKRFSLLRPPKPTRIYPGFRPLRTSATTTETETVDTDDTIQPLKHSILLERLRLRHLKDSAKPQETKTSTKKNSDENVGLEKLKESGYGDKKKQKVVGSFEELGLSDEVMGAVREMGIEVPTEIQSIGIPAVLEGKSVVLGSHTGSGKTLAYMLPLVQLMRQDEAMFGMLMKPRRPRAVVLCPTRELSEQVFRVAKSISHHARFRSTMVSGGGRLRPQEDSLNGAIDMVVGTPGRILQHIQDGNIVYGDIKYVVLDEADTMFDHGFGPDIRKFLGPLKNRASKPDGQGFQTVLVAATMTKAVQNLIDEEFQGIVHLRTSTLHKKVASARHDFIKLSGSENKLEALLQVLEPSLAKGNKVMVFCNTLNSSRAVDHFLSENQTSTVNYHGEVPAEQRVENLKKFKTEDGDCPTLVCSDLAARGLDLDVDHVIMFDFPLNSIDYLHRTGRTARMGAKGKVTSLVAKKDVALATRIEEAMRKNESLESLSVNSVRRDIARARITEQKGKNEKLIKVAKQRSRDSAKSYQDQGVKSKKASGPAKFAKASVKVSKTVKLSGASSSRKSSSSARKQVVNKGSSAAKSTSSKLNVVGFRGRNSWSNKKEPAMAR